MIGRIADLILAVAWTVGTVSVVLLVPSLEVLRVVLGVPFVLFLPGYCLVAALYPRRDDLEGFERLALGFALSIAVVLLIALALNYSPWGVRPTPILAFLAGFIVLAAVAAAGRRWLLPAEQAFAVTSGVRLPRRPKLRVRPIDGVLALTLAVLLAGLGAVVYFVGTSAGGSEGYTEFYVLGPEGKAEGYPGVVKAGEEATAVLGLVNHEGQDTAYRIVVRFDGENADDIDDLVLENGERWEETVALVPPRAGNDQKAELLLYKDGGGEPYRSLHLWMNVEATPTKTARPSPSPTRTSTVTSPPAAAISIDSGGLFYVVQPGDTLTDISDRFGLDPEVVAAANGMDQPGPVLVGEELRIPGVVYSVQTGDTLDDIAVAFGVPQAAIMDANAITDADAISGGERLAIPGGGVALPMARTPAPSLTPTPSSTSAVTPTPSPGTSP